MSRSQGYRYGAGNKFSYPGVERDGGQFGEMRMDFKLHLNHPGKSLRVFSTEWGVGSDSV